MPVWPWFIFSPTLRKISSTAWAVEGKAPQAKCRTSSAQMPLGMVTIIAKSRRNRRGVPYLRDFSIASGPHRFHAKEPDQHHAQEHEAVPEPRDLRAAVAAGA